MKVDIIKAIDEMIAELEKENFDLKQSMKSRINSAYQNALAEGQIRANKKGITRFFSIKYIVCKE